MVRDEEVTFTLLSDKYVKCNHLLLGMNPVICYFIFLFGFIISVFACVCVFIAALP